MKVLGLILMLGWLPVFVAITDGLKTAIIFAIILTCFVTGIWLFIKEKK